MEPVVVKDAPTPTWTVDVIRDSGSVLVGTLTVNNETLPPRKNKKKIAWKLPDDRNTIPKFGEHEKKRLWELFKEQKKVRRRQSKKLTSFPSMQSEGDNSEAFSQEAEEVGDAPPPTETANTTPDHSVAEGTEGPDDYGGAEPTPDARAPSLQHLPPPNPAAFAKIDSPTSKENVSPPSPPPPPPGFQMNKMSLEDQQSEKEITRNPAQTFAPPPPPPQSTPPPPPPHMRANPPPPPGIIPPSESTLPPSLYFSLADDKPLAALGAVVVPYFLQCVTTSTVVPWLAHSHPTLSQTTLSLGSAQATGRTYIDRLQQWQSLTLSNSWDCTGCTTQTLPLPNTVLLVLTGRTIQKQECLAYHLSLVLTAPSVGTKNFQITNEVLSLTALNTVPMHAA